ncbi:Tn7-like element transposition protein TnsE [Gallaecimonas pentaromativorans]|uniref:Tn7-like element transposition protein TnsE n=1 Tax=Gallaecimonas pentaromativorans TaxID=584787 RepID=UPI00067EEC2D|nr:Tn7-like element transposition protein TnsE [Gallaecimonas pentaromativorans]
MSRILFSKIPKGDRLLAIGNFFKKDEPTPRWRLGSLFDQGGELRQRWFDLEMSCILGVGREFVGEDNAPYLSHGFRKRLELPPVEDWQDRPLGECPRLARRLARNPEVAGQRCFVFEADGLTVWLPKFELARKLFFHAAFLVRAAFDPNGLDMAFSVYKEGDVTHIRTPSKVGAPSQLLKIKGYRDHFSWLLLDPDVRRSFESIWRSLNEEQISTGSRYARWQFNFIPPSCLAGVTMEVQGPLDWDSRDLLVWEIKVLQGLKFPSGDAIFFHHPSLRQPVRGEGGGWIRPAPGGGDIEVDAEEEPDEAKERQLLDLPIEGIAFDGYPATRIAYKGQRASGHGKKVDEDTVPGGDTKTLGVADDATGGTIAPGEFQQLESQRDQGQYPNRFVLLREIIREIAKEPGIELLELEVKPLPQVPRCSYHMMDKDTPRCYLMAKFRLEDGRERYLLEIDTSDNKKRLSTRIVSFQAEINPRDGIDRILKDAVKASLRWPVFMEKVCESFHSIHHPKESSSNEHQARVDAWELRLKACLT